MNGLLGGGILLTILAATWQHVRGFLWKFAQFFICRTIFEGCFAKYGCVYVWDKLKHKRSLSPIYTFDFLGSGSESKVFIKEIGFRNYRVIFINKTPCLAIIDQAGTTIIYSFKLFLSYEHVFSHVIMHYNTKVRNETTKKTANNFSTEYIRGSLNKDKRSFREDCGEVPKPSNTESVGYNNMSLRSAEQLNIGRRVNYTAEEFRQFSTFTQKDNRLIDNLYLTESMLDVKDKIQKWFDHKDWFMERSIQWKRGVLLHGLPGTGKTSFISALGEYFNIPVFIFDLSTFTNEDLHERWQILKSYTPCFVVFEDFDSVFDGRTNVYTQNAMANKPISFDCVLNVLDGAVKFDGIVTFITTNNIDKIDPALGGGGNTRPGRIDYVYEMDTINEYSKQFIMDYIFKGMDNKNSLMEQALQVECTTPAQFKEVCINLALSCYDDVEETTNIDGAEIEAAPVKLEK